MDDKQIVDLYLARKESALRESQRKYGRMLCSLAMSLLKDAEDSKECENDTYFTAWKKIPPDRPEFLGAYLAKITRFLCMNFLRKKSAQKQPVVSEAIEELGECIPSGETVEGSMENKQLRAILNDFLRLLPADHRYIFVRRYFYAQSVKEIACSLSFSEGKVKTILFRMRGELKKRLEKEGWR